MIIISWLRSFGIKTNLERLVFKNVVDSTRSVYCPCN